MAERERKKKKKNSRVLLVGVTYKRDIEDLRESPALKVWELLEHKGAIVDYHDPYCSEVEQNKKIFRSRPLTPETAKTCDAAVITTGHWNNVDYNLLLQNAPLILDTKNVIGKLLETGPKEHENLHLL